MQHEIRTKCTHKSPAVRLCLSMKNFKASAMSSIPSFAGYLVSISEKVTMEPSAPPPLEVKTSVTLTTTGDDQTYPPEGDHPIASWNAMRKTSWTLIIISWDRFFTARTKKRTSSPHTFSKWLVCISSRTRNKAQQASWETLFLPSGHVCFAAGTAIHWVCQHIPHR